MFNSGVFNTSKNNTIKSLCLIVAIRLKLLNVLVACLRCVVIDGQKELMEKTNKLGKLGKCWHTSYA
jgi:hypothetical protein